MSESSAQPELRDPNKVDLWRQLVVVGVTVLALLAGPLLGFLVFLGLVGSTGGGVIGVLLGLVSAMVIVAGFVMAPIWTYRRLIGRRSGVHSRSGGASSAQ